MFFENPGFRVKKNIILEYVKVNLFLYLFLLNIIHKSENVAMHNAYSEISDRLEEINIQYLQFIGPLCIPTSVRYST